MKSQRIPVAPEGYPFLLFTGFATLVCAVLGLTVPSLAMLAGTAFILWFFRDPERVIPEVSGGIIAPADGRIILIKQVDDPRFFPQRVLKISIFMNVFNVHVNRAPCSGTVEKIHLQPGRFYAADKNKAELHNEYCAMTMKTPAGGRLCVVQVAGLIARRIVCRAEQGDMLRAGERYGLIRFGSRVDLYLPPESQVQVRLRQKVRAGETLLALFPKS